MSGPIPEPVLPEGWRLDTETEQNLHHRGIWHVVTDQGLRTAWNGDEPVICPVCKADPEKMPDCTECYGRGVVDHIPLAPRPYDQIIDHLYLGGHDYQGGEFIVDDRFDVVVSLHQRWNNMPPIFVEHHTFRIGDSELDPSNHSKLDEFAETVAQAVDEGRDTFVRCQAGLNRSALVTGLAMIQLGWSADLAIDLMRQLRSPYVLCNASFVNYLKEKDA